MPTAKDVQALIELLTKCDVKIESVPDGSRLYYLNELGWVVSDGTNMQPCKELSKAIVAFTKLIYT